MKISCYGSRGSIPVSGKIYNKYGGDTTCLTVQAEDGASLIIDAGSGIRALGNEAIKQPCSSCSILLTHAHWDHILGFPFFKPVYSKNFKINIYGWFKEGIEKIINEVLKTPFFPINTSAMYAELVYNNMKLKPFKIGSIGITPIKLNHPNGGVGFIFTEGKTKFVFLTDNELGFSHSGGLSFTDYVKFCRGADLLVHDAEFTPEEYQFRKGWGHSTYQDAARLAIEADVKKLGLFHHNQDRDDAGVDNIVKLTEKILKKNNSKIDCFALAGGQSVSL